MGTAGLSLVSPVFAGGDHHDHGEKKCKDNGDNNCNDTHKTQKIKAKNDCEIKNYNKDHSKDNTNVNDLTCANDAQNLKDVEQIFGLTDGGPASTKRSSRQQPITTVTTLEKLSYRLTVRAQPSLFLMVLTMYENQLTSR